MPEDYARAQTLLAQEKEEALLTNFLLVVDLLKLAGISAQELMTGHTGEDTEARMKRAIFQVARTLQISPEILYQRIDTTYNGGLTTDSIFIFSTDPDSARYSLSFSDVFARACLHRKG
mgnify:CR=1 FL=1